jgi:proteasome lid subunit RPN8/RPN11
MLPGPLAAQIQAEAMSAFPRECCGLIEGRIEDIGRDEIFDAHGLHPAHNLATAPDRFEIAPEDHVAAAKAARARGHRLIGCYHSHPNGRPEPSPRDEGGEDNFVWLIVATGGASPEIAAWLYRKGGFTPLELISALGADLVTSSLKERS